MRLFSRKNKRKTSLKSIFIITIKLATLFLLIGFVVWNILISNPTKFLNVSIQWDLDADLPITEQLLVNKIQPHLSDKYKLDLHQIKQAIEQEPWVESANVERLFWNFIKIKVNSRKIAMQWKNVKCTSNIEEKNCFGYISTNGELFAPRDISQFDNIQAISNTETETIRELYSDYKNYQALIDPMLIKTIIKTNIDKIIVEPNISVILGYKMQRDRLVRFKSVYSKLRKENKKIDNAIFDMRYPKGFSLGY
jgi:cell division septal protein FtsQ